MTKQKGATTKNDKLKQKALADFTKKVELMCFFLQNLQTFFFLDRNETRQNRTEIVAPLKL